MSIVFAATLILLCFAMLLGFIVGFRKVSLALLFFTPLLAFGISTVYFSYESVLGYAYKTTWQEMPERFTVIYFRIQGTENITLWLFDKKTTRLVELPYEKGAEDAVEQGRKSMGEGTPVTFRRKSKGEIALEGGKDDCDGEGDGKTNGKGKRSWLYIIESEGDPIPGEGFPPK